MSSPSVPLHGQRILLTRPHAALPLLTEQLQAAGATVWAVPLIEIEFVPVSCPDWSEYDWLLMTSKNAVEGLFQSLAGAAFPPLPLAVVGAATAEAASSLGYAPAFVGPSVGGVEAVHAFWKAYGGSGLRVLWPCGSLARNEVKATLEALGAVVTPWEVYHTGYRTELSRQERDWLASPLDWILFTSPSTVETFVRLQGGVLSPATGIACMGATTAQAVARLLGRTAEVVPQASSQEALASALLSHGSSVSTL